MNDYYTVLQVMLVFQGIFLFVFTVLHYSNWYVRGRLGVRSLNMHMTVSLNWSAIGSMLYSEESQIGRELID